VIQWVFGYKWET